MKRFLLSFFIIFLIYVPCIFAQDEPRVKFSKTKNLHEFEVVLFVHVPDSLYLDLNNTYLSFVDNNPMSKDCGEYRILHFYRKGDHLVSIFLIENSAPPKFVRLHLVFRNKSDYKLKTKSHEYEIILENNFWVLPKNGAKNVFYIYFNDSEIRDCDFFSFLGSKISNFTNVRSGDEITIENYPQGIYFLSIYNFGTKKVLIK